MAGMRFPGNVVTKHDTRSGAGGRGVPTKCLYCAGIPGGLHEDTCVCLDRPIKIRFSLEFIVTSPRSWAKEDIEFRYNEGSYCLDNLIENELTRVKEVDGCLCNSGSVEYLGEATLEEAEAAGLKRDSE